MMLILVAFINFLTIIPIISILRPKSTVYFLVSSFILYISNIVLIGNFLGLISHLSDIYAWLLTHFLLLIIAWLLWFRLNCPRLLPPVSFSQDYHKFSSLEKFTVTILTTSILVCYSILILLIIIVPPNNNDSMLVHLTRVGYWIQHGSFAPWTAINERQLIYPYNGQIVLLWLIIFIKNDLLTPFLQFFCSLFTAICIFGISRLLRANIYVSYMLGGLYLTLPQVILQSTTTQNDLVVAFFVMGGTYFLLDWLKNALRPKVSIILSAISYAISLGVKATSFYFFIGLILSIGILIILKKISLKLIIYWGLVTVLSFLLLSSPAYVLNLIHFGSPLGSRSFLHSEAGVLGEDNLLDKLRINSYRFVYHLISLDGFPFSIQKKFNKIKSEFAKNYPNIFDTSSRYVKDPYGETFTLSPKIANSEDFSWFGPLAPLLILPAIMLSAIKILHDRDPLIMILLISGLVSFFLVTILRPGYDPYQGRYLNTSVAVLFPLSSLLFTRQSPRSIVMSIILFLSLIPLFFVTVANDAKPLITVSISKKLYNSDCGKVLNTKYLCFVSSLIPERIISDNFPNKPSILGFESRIARQTYTFRSQFRIFSLIETLPSNSKISIILSEGDWEYPYFGSSFQHKVYPIPNPTHITTQNLELLGVNYLVVHNKDVDINKIKFPYKLIYIIPGNEVDWYVFRLEENQYLNNYEFSVF